MGCPHEARCASSVCPLNPYDGIRIAGEHGCSKPKYAVQEMVSKVPYLARLKNKKRKLKPFIKDFRLDHDSLLLSYAEYINKHR